jgi:hypothetical protein
MNIRWKFCNTVNEENFHQCTKDIYLKIKTIQGIKRWRPDGFSRKDQRGGSHKKIIGIPFN